MTVLLLLLRVSVSVSVSYVNSVIVDVGAVAVIVDGFIDGSVMYTDGFGRGGCEHHLSFLCLPKRGLLQCSLLAFSREVDGGG